MNIRRAVVGLTTSATKQAVFISLCAILLVAIIYLLASNNLGVSSSSSSSSSSLTSVDNTDAHPQSQSENEKKRRLLNEEQEEDSKHHKKGSTSTSISDSPRVAISALLTANSKRGETLHRAIDGLAVLRRSIREVTPADVFQRISFVPLLAGSVSSKQWDPILKKVGWTNIRRYDHPPLDPTKIRNPQIAKEIVTDGAIGVDELLKLNVFEWGDEFDIVLLVDCDVLFHKNFPELISRPSGKALRWTKGGWASERINGGFLVIEPKGSVGKVHRERMLEIVLEGDFRPGTGWRGSGIGWTYGGRTIQGVLPFYFLHKQQQKQQQQEAEHHHPRGANDSQSVASASSIDPLQDQLQIDRCRYNNMDQLPECKALSIDKVTSNHFTGDCVKPWWCGARRTVRCERWARRWRLLLAKEMVALGVAQGSSVYGMENSCEAAAALSLAQELEKKFDAAASI